MNTAIDHSQRGFWCDFCKDYHATIECQHPAFNEPDLVEELAEAQSQADAEYDRAEEAEQERDRLEELLGAAEDLLPDIEALDQDLADRMRKALGL